MSDSEESEQQVSEQLENNIQVLTRDYVHEVKGKADKYVAGELDLGESLRKAEDLYNKHNFTKGVMPGEVIYDSDLMKLHSVIVDKKTKSLQANTLAFNVQDFASAMQEHICKNLTGNSRDLSEVWLKLGNFSKLKICSSPAFHYMHGSFEPGKLELKARAKKVKEKDVLGKEVTPKSVSLNETQVEQDITTEEVQRILSILHIYYKKNNGPVCYFEFVTDPSSFAHTVENMFYVSFLVKHGAVAISYDEDNLPALTPRTPDKNSDNTESNKQSILSISIKDWKEIIDTYKIRKAIIPPRKKNVM